MVRSGMPADFEAIDAFDPFAGDRHDELANGHCLVAECDQHVVGYVTFSAAGFLGRPFVHYLVVAQAYRRRGIATALLASVESKVGPGRVFISTEEDNHVMLALLGRLRWTEAGRVEGVNLSGAAELFFFRDIA